MECQVVTVKNNTEHEIENLSVSEVLDTDLVQLLDAPSDYENGAWMIDRLDADGTAVLVLPVKALKKHSVYENTIHLWFMDTGGKNTEILPGPDDQPTAIVEIREAEKNPEDPKPPVDPPSKPEPKPKPEPPVNPEPTHPVPSSPVTKLAIQEEDEVHIVSGKVREPQADEKQDERIVKTIRKPVRDRKHQKCKDCRQEMVSLNG